MHGDDPLGLLSAVTMSIFRVPLIALRREDFLIRLLSVVIHLP